MPATIPQHIMDGACRQLLCGCLGFESFKHAAEAFLDEILELAAPQGRCGLDVRYNSSEGSTAVPADD